MRHHNANRKFSRVRKVRKALINSLARSLMLHQKIKTTEPKAKELRSFAEKLITTGRKDTVANRRNVVIKVGSKAAKVLFEDLAKKYKDRKGGYTRIIKTEERKSDGSKMAIIELI